MGSSQYPTHNDGVLQARTATVARTDTVAKNLFSLPARAIVTAIRIFGAAASNAGTTATLSVGKAGAATHFVNALDIKTAATGAGQVNPNATNLGDVGADAITVQGLYAETGGASSAGGPWTVIVEFLA